MLKAALIDLDGFLVNTEELYFEANKIYFKGLGFEFTEKIQAEGTGKKFPEWIITVFPLNKSGEEIFQERNLIFNQLLDQELNLMPGAKKFLTKIHEKFKTALVTTSRQDYVIKVLSKTGITDDFDLLVTGDMVRNGKPDPECYLLAAQTLGVAPNECVVFEDSPNGIRAGKTAAMTAVAVPSRFVKGDSVFDQADFVFNSLNEIRIDHLTKK